MRLSIFLFFILFSFGHLSAQNHHNHDHHGHEHHAHDGHDHGSHDHDAHGHDGHSADPCGHHDVEGHYDPTNTAYHHIGDANVYSIGPISIPLPCILYAPGHGLDVFSSGKFDVDHHGTGSKAVKGYVIYEGMVRRVVDGSFPRETEDVCVYSKKEDGKEIVYTRYNGKDYACHNQSTMDFGLFGGGITSFHDFSITKNVVTMFIVFLFMFWMFRKIARMYANNENQAPSGIQSFMEPIILFIQDEVAKPFLGAKWDKYLPFLLSLFFFILGLNLFGQIPFFGSSNVTGNLAFTAVLAIITFFVVSFSGNKDYWEHVFWMPGVPGWVKIILTPVEVAGLFIKPITLMLRLFANITAGHIVVLSFVGLIFILGKAGTSLEGAIAGTVAALPLTLFMLAIELLVAFIQAFVFTILTASYLGAATEEHHH